MLSWLSQISKNNEIPHFNDSTFGIAYNYLKFNYSKKLNIIADNIKLSDSGYRKYNGEKYGGVILEDRPHLSSRTWIEDTFQF